MITSRWFGLLVLTLLLILSCKNNKAISTKPGTETGGAADIAGNHARIIARIVSVADTREEDGPCSKAPCTAAIKTESILKKGPLFQMENISDTLEASFAFTLSPATQELFPAIKSSYPGLKINDRFEATIESRPAKNEKGIRYIIYDYKLLSHEK